MHARDGVDLDELTAEVRTLYEERVKLQPYRWYAMPANFHGTYINTDAQGFRASPPVSGDGPLIGMFGSSTMFSVTTKDEHSIPAFLGQSVNRDAIQVKNFGMGGYSSSAELALLIETARSHRLAVAVFYDGPNEFERYIEKLQDDPPERYYDVVGYPLSGPWSHAIDLAGDQLFAYDPYTLQLARRVIQRLPFISRNANALITAANADQHADAVVRLYLRNVQDIAAIAKAHDIVPVFLWQPDIFTTKKQLSAYERQVAESQPALKLLSDAVRRKLLANPALKDYRFFDISDAVDGLDASTHFLDEVHVSFEANRMIAERIAAILKTLTPPADWKNP
jgi:lysophospholipase L1-like esterase